MQTNPPVLKVVVFLWFLMVGFELMAQKDSSTASMQEFALAAATFESRQMLDSAVFYHHKVAELYYQNDQLYEYINSFTNIADIFITQGEYQNAIAWLDSAYNKPVSSFRNEDERLALLEWHLFKGFAYEQLGDFVSARTIYESAKLKLVNKEEYEDFYVGKFLYQPLGNIYTRLGDHEEAIKLLGRFKEISFKYGDNNAVAQAINDLGIIYKILNRHNLAIAEYKAALELPKLGLSTIGLIKSNLATAYYESHKLKQGLICADEAIEIFEKILAEDSLSMQNNSYLAWTYNLLGLIYTDRGQFGEAVKYFKKSLDLSVFAYGTTKRREIAKIYISIGELFLIQNQPEQSLDYFQEALISVVADFEASNPEINPEIDQLYSENTIFEAMEGKSRAFKMMYNQSEDIKYLSFALANYQLIRAVERLLRMDFQHESSKLLLSRESHIRSEEALEVVYQLYETIEDSAYLEEAFRIIENNKASVLLASVKDLKNKDFANIPNWLLSKEQQLKSMKSIYQRQLLEYKLAPGEDSMAEKELQSKMYRLDNELLVIEDKLKQEFPNYYQLKNASTASISIADIRKLVVDKHNDLLEYFVGNRAIYILHISRNNTRLIRIEKDTAFEEQVLSLINMVMDSNIATSRPGDFGKLSASIYEKLINPLKIDEKVKNLIIIPDGVLGYLPFDILTDKNEFKKLNYSDLPYLIKNYALSYAFSANVLFENQNYQVEKDGKRTFLGVAPIYHESNQFAYLPFSKSEVEKIQARLGGEILLAGRATKAKFKSMARDYRVLHISTHAATTDSLPLYSWIGFSDLSSQNQDHYKLYLSELYAMNLGAELAVLSACETGRGRFSRGEGIMSMARGFAYAGCQSIVTTLWPVNDATTAKIMEKFYLHLQKGQPKAAALRNAKLDYLKNGSVDELGAHPFFWGAYISIGNVNPIYQKNNYTVFMWIAIAFLILAIITFIYLKKRQSLQNE